jgi:hypothetical protein
MEKEIVVYGAYGHTGRFVVRELSRRGLPCVIAGRNASKLEPVSRETGFQALKLETDDEDGFRQLLADKAALINCAGPFLDTAPSLVEHAIRSEIPYFDVAAEQRVVYDLFEEYGEKETGVLIVPGVAFYGQLGELLIAEALGDLRDAHVTLAIGLDSWEPTEGTRRTGEKNPGLRRHLVDGRLDLQEPFPARTWNFNGPLGDQAMLSLALSEAVLVERSKKVKDLRVYINEAPIQDLSNPATPAPTPADEFGASSQVWAMEVEVTGGASTRRSALSGRDIYAVSGQLVVHAVQAVRERGSGVTGIRPLSQVVDPGEFLDSFIARSDYIVRG